MKSNSPKLISLTYTEENEKFPFFQSLFLYDMSKFDEANVSTIG